jgi:hypothetical protein
LSLSASHPFADTWVLYYKVQRTFGYVVRERKDPFRVTTLSLSASHPFVDTWVLYYKVQRTFGYVIRGQKDPFRVTTLSLSASHLIEIGRGQAVRDEDKPSPLYLIGM